MIIDSSAWIEFLRATGSPADRVLTRSLAEGAPLVVTGTILQEVLQGCRSEAQVAEVRDLLLTCENVEPIFPETYEHAAVLYRRCRSMGRTVRGGGDCLVAALALENGLSLLAHDRDFEPLGTYCGLVLR